MPSSRRPTVRDTRAAVAVVAVLCGLTGLAACGSAGTGSVGSGSAGSGPADLAATAACSPDQVVAAIVDEDAGASNRYATLRLTARPGRSCRLAGPLDVGLRGAGDLAVRRAGGGPGVLVLDATHPASSTLHWTVAADRQVTPQALTVALSGGAAEVGWTFGPVDGPPGHGVEVGPLTPDPAR